MLRIIRAVVCERQPCYCGAAGQVRKEVSLYGWDQRRNHERNATHPAALGVGYERAQAI